MPKIFEIKPLFTEQIPDIIEEGVLYISEKYEVAVHLCACGCKGKTVLPLGYGEWNLREAFLFPHKCGKEFYYICIVT